MPFPQKQICGVVRIKVTGSERKRFRRDMGEYRKLSAAYTALLREKDVKSPSERQAALAQAKQQYEQAASAFYFTYNESPVLNSVWGQDKKIQGWSALVILTSFSLAVYLFMKGHPASQENIKEIMDFFRHHTIERAGSAILTAVGLANLFLLMPLENFFSNKPHHTFCEIDYKVNMRKYEKEPKKP